MVSDLNPRTHGRYLTDEHLPTPVDALTAQKEADSVMHQIGQDTIDGLIAQNEAMAEALRETVDRVEQASDMIHNSQHWYDNEAPDGEGTLHDWVFAPSIAALTKAEDK